MTNVEKLEMIYDAVESTQQSLCGEDGLSEGEEKWLGASPELLKYLEGRMKATKSFVVRVQATYTTWMEQEFTSAHEMKKFLRNMDSKDVMADLICEDLESSRNRADIALSVIVEEHK